MKDVQSRLLRLYYDFDFDRSQLCEQRYEARMDNERSC